MSRKLALKQSAKEKTTPVAPPKSIPLADASYVLPKLPVKQSISSPPPAIQMAIAEIVEEADHITYEKAIEEIENNPTENTEILSAIPESISIEIIPDLQTVKEAFSAFAKKQSPSNAALIRMFEPKIAGYEITVAMHKANINLMDALKVEWQLFLRQYFSVDNLVLNLLEDNTEVKQTKAYTQREQLEELAKENPLMRELIKKLNLKLK